MKATVLILLDAMRWDYIDKDVTPFLASCAEEGHHVHKVIPGIGFCERAEILTGLPPEDTGYFTAIGYDPERSPYKKFRIALSFLAFTERLIPTTFYAKAIRKLIKFAVKSHPHSMKPYRIPLNLLHKFALTEDYYDHRDTRAFEHPNLLAMLEDAGLTYFYDSFTALNLISGGSDKERFALALAAAEKGHALYFVFNSVPDAFGHKYGGNAPETKTALSKMDSSLQDFVEEFESRRPDSRFIFVGDHGMVDVEKTIDVEEVIKTKAGKAKLRLGKDYTYFLDSTLCRIWLHNSKARAQFANAIIQDESLLKNGVFVDEEIAKRYHIPFGDQRYGDILWWANAGTMVLPDFFHRKDESVKGMHGYDPDHSHSQGSCIVVGAGQASCTSPQLPLTAVNALLKESITAQTGIDI